MRIKSENVKVGDLHRYFENGEITFALIVSIKQGKNKTYEVMFLGADGVLFAYTLNPETFYDFDILVI